jgi:hypothetical protein
VKAGGPSSSAQSIAFQDDHEITSSMARWSRGKEIVDGPRVINLPSAVASGEFAVYIGMIDPETGKRVHLIGTSNDFEEYEIGTLTAQPDRDISFRAAPLGPQANANGVPRTVMNFGKIQTDGMVFLSRQGNEWRLIPFPRTRNFTVLLNAKAFPPPGEVRSTDADVSSFKPVLVGNMWWRLNLQGAASYSWAAAGQKSSGGL